MAFGQVSGPPAPRRQVEELLDLVVAAGYADFREARHPLGLTQRQAAGRFTRDEADELAARLEGAAPAADLRLAEVADADLAAELQRRGWVVMEP